MSLKQIMTQRIELLPAGVKYYKANLHCHTVLSDGRLTPEEIKKAYQEKGYQVVAFTDHRIYRNHEELNDEGFVAIAAIETDINEEFCPQQDFSHTKTYHINWYDTDPRKRPEEKRALGNMEQRYHDEEYIHSYAERMRELGFLACYNHAYWSLQDYRDYSGLKDFWAMEIYNHGCEMDGLYGYHPQVYDEMLRSGSRLFCVSTDDNHNLAGFGDAMCDSFGGYVMIGAGELTYEGIMEALRRGDFYSVASQDGRTEGPEIYEMTLEAGRLHISCSPADKIYVQTSGRDCLRAAAQPGRTITEADFTLTGREGYIRLSVRDGQGRAAHSNAYFLDDFLMEPGGRTCHAE